MVSGRGYFVNTSSAEGILKFPATAQQGDFIEIKDYARRKEMSINEVEKWLQSNI